MRRIHSPKLSQPSQIYKSTKKTFKCLIRSKLMQLLSLHLYQKLKSLKADKSRKILRLHWTKNCRTSQYMRTAVTYHRNVAIGQLGTKMTARVRLGQIIAIMTNRTLIIAVILRIYLMCQSSSQG